MQKMTKEERNQIGMTAAGYQMLMEIDRKIEQDRKIRRKIVAKMAVPVLVILAVYLIGRELGL